MGKIRKIWKKNRENVMGKKEEKRGKNWKKGKNTSKSNEEKFVKIRQKYFGEKLAKKKS